MVQRDSLKPPLHFLFCPNIYSKLFSERDVRRDPQSHSSITPCQPLPLDPLKRLFLFLIPPADNETIFLTVYYPPMKIFLGILTGCYLPFSSPGLAPRLVKVESEEERTGKMEEIWKNPQPGIFFLFSFFVLVHLVIEINVR